MPHNTVASDLGHHHAVTFYDHAHELVDVVARMAAEALVLGEHVVLVATLEHRTAIDRVLRGRGIAVDLERAAGRLVTLDASETLAGFLVDGAPDKDLFAAGVGSVLRAASERGTPVRVFGEMVALLWDSGNVAGALQLEALWNDLMQHQAFDLLCAYPTSSLDTARLGDLGDVCARHTRLLPPSSYLTDSSSGPAGAQHSRVFLPVPEAVAAVRRFVTGILERWREDELVADAILVCSELATNAVLHADSPFRVSVDRSVGVVCIAIQDVSIGRAEQREAAYGAVDGRGMLIIESVARRWGSYELPGGKVVWAELASTT